MMHYRFCGNKVPQNTPILSYSIPSSGVPYHHSTLPYILPGTDQIQIVDTRFQSAYSTISTPSYLQNLPSNNNNYVHSTADDGDEVYTIT